MASNEAMQEEESSNGLAPTTTIVHDELELGLALTLGGASHPNNTTKNNSSWGHELYGRILTAKDFPNGFSSSTTRRPSSDHSDSSTPILSQVVGWPPIRAYRMNTLVSQAKTQNTLEPDQNKVIAGNHDDNNVEESKDMILCHKNVNDKTTSSTRIGFVKVNMDGMPIGRKVNLKAHESYDALANTVEDMFFNSHNINTSSFMNGEKKKPVKLLDSSSEFVLTYEDRDGDWMLLGDVPWGMFISNVKKLRIMRTFEANGLSTPKLQARK